MKQLLTALLACVLLNLTGCISYSNHDLPLVKQWPPADALPHKQSAFIKVDTQVLFNGKNRASNVNQAALDNLILQQYQGSERFSDVTLNKQTSDLYINVRISNNELGNMVSAFITGFTLFVIPGKYDNEITMESVFKDGSGKVLGRIEKRETITTWMQLLLIVAVPFNARLDDVIIQLTQSSLEEAARQKLI